MIVKFPLRYTPRRGQERMIHLYLPDDYDSSEERYPVIYMFDGHNLFFDEDATYNKSWGLKEFLDHWHKKVIVVGMECSHTGNDRLSEYSPYPFSSRLFKNIKGTGDKTMRWIVKYVKPYIDTHYRTWSHREATAIAGSSMGGLMALFGVVKYNNWFSKAACVSPAIGYVMTYLRKDLKTTDLNPDTRIFFSWGTEEWPEYARTMTRNILNAEAMVQQKGASTWLFNQQGGHHCEADWEKQIPTWMEFLWN